MVNFLSCLVIFISAFLFSAHATDNYLSCLNGYEVTCDESLLSPDQKIQVKKEALKRNYLSCLNGYEITCDESLLTPYQKDQSKKEALKRNYLSCLNGYEITCDESLLTQPQKKELAHATSISSRPNTFTAPSTRSVDSSSVRPLLPSSPYCAENGSCYGDISNSTGRAKTIHVKGYYRKDGTYVRGHYRSKPTN